MCGSCPPSLGPFFFILVEKIFIYIYISECFFSFLEGHYKKEPLGCGWTAASNLFFSYLSFFPQTRKNWPLYNSLFPSSPVCREQKKKAFICTDVCIHAPNRCGLLVYFRKISKEISLLQLLRASAVAGAFFSYTEPSCCYTHTTHTRL